MLLCVMMGLAMVLTHVVSLHRQEVSSGNEEVVAVLDINKPKNAFSAIVCCVVLCCVTQFSIKVLFLCN